jgi:hypothetical protein
MANKKIRVIRVTRDVTDRNEAVRDWLNELTHGTYLPRILSLRPFQHCVVRIPLTVNDLAWMDALERQAELNKRVPSKSIVVLVDPDKVWVP